MPNTREYEWSDISVVLGNRDLTGIRGIKYSEKKETEPLYAKGKYPHSIQDGNRSVEGEITILQSEYEALIKAGNGSILNLRGMTAVVNYGNPPDPITTDIITGITFTEAGKEFKQGDKFAEVSLAFVATGLKNQVA